jgi:RsiW-degrading membrane proteinase PrsW (M82 family)
MSSFLLFLAVLPGLLLSYAAFRADRYEREGLGPLLCCFCLGALATYPAMLLEKWAFPGYDANARLPLGQALGLSFGVAALSEEGFKFLALLLGAWPWRFFNEPMDGIVYAVLVSMGFASAENLLYAQRFGAESVWLRAFTAVPAHLVFGIVMGYYAGLAKFGRRLLLAPALGLALLLHGTYDLLILQRWSDWLVVLASVGLYLSLYYCGDLVRQHQENSPFKKI